MIDTLESNRVKASNLIINEIIKDNFIQEQKSNDLNNFNSPTSHYTLMTMHRPSNVDKKEILEPIIRFLLDEVSLDMPIIWPIHPRTQNQLKQFGLWDRAILNAKLILTDSGGLQEECTVLGTPCLTLRWNTERPITLRKNGGASVLVGNNISRIREEYKNTLELNRTPDRPELWDGKTAERVLESILKAKI